MEVLTSAFGGSKSGVLTVAVSNDNEHHRCSNHNVMKRTTPAVMVPIRVSCPYWSLESVSAYVIDESVMCRRRT